MTALYLDLGREEGQELSALDERVALARKNGLQVIIALPTAPGFPRAPSATSQSYRDRVAKQITEVVTHFRGNPAVAAWATGDFLEQVIEHDPQELGAYLQRWYGDLDALNHAWGSRLRTWGEVTEEAARSVDKDRPYGIGPATLDLAEYARQAYGDVMAHWARTIRALDATRPLMTGRVGLYCCLTAIPQGFDVVCPAMSPDELEPDPLSHNVHGVDMARRSGRFQVVPCVDLPRELGGLTGGQFRRWVGLAALHGARGVGIADWSRIDRTLAPEALLGALARDLSGLGSPECFRVRPRPSFAFLYEPYAAGFQVGTQPVYGFARGFSEGEPTNPYSAFRLGCAFGWADYLTLEDLPATDLARYGAVFAPLAVRMPDSVQRQLEDYVRGGGALVCDLGLGVWETGNWLVLPPALGALLGVPWLGEMKETAGNLSVSWQPRWMPSLEPGAVTRGAFKPQGAPGSMEARKRYHVSGPVAFARPGPDTRALAVFNMKYSGRQRLLAGLLAREVGEGVACFATHRLWANWLSDDPTYVAFHHDLCERRSRVEMLGVAFWTEGICAISTEDGAAVFNARPGPDGADVICYDAAHALYTNAACTFSALARNPDGTRSGAVKVSVQLPALSLVTCRRVPLLVQPFDNTCLARLVELSARRVVLEVGGDGAGILRRRDGTLALGQGAATEVRFTLQDGTYPVRPGSRHRVRMETAAGEVQEAVVAGLPDKVLRFTATVTHGTVTVSPAGPG